MSLQIKNTDGSFTTIAGNTVPNIITSWNDTASDEKVPSEKLVKSIFDDWEELTITSDYMDMDNANIKAYYSPIRRAVKFDGYFSSLESVEYNKSMAHGICNLTRSSSFNSSASGALAIIPDSYFPCQSASFLVSSSKISISVLPLETFSSNLGVWIYLGSFYI